ncbi:PilZ domain-containing protein [Blastococcus montanus]|uniref:PilZ domain-containing protein n=1 Tax=Blastococcus montanus TaxID=3144973 RepID=UPI003207C087
MADSAGVDYPEPRAVVDLLVTSKGDVLLSWVEAAGDAEIVVTVGEDRSKRRVRLEPGEHVEVVWRGPEELRSRPTELVATQLDPPQWRLRPVGPATRGQRRSAVRAPLSVQVQMTVGSEVLQGSTLDISEGGMRALFGPLGTADRAALTDEPADEPTEADATGAPAEPSAGAEPPRPEKEDRLRIGAVLPLVLCLEQEEVPCRGEVTRRIPRQDGRTELCFRFVDMHERTQDRIRRHVFAGLRTLRARGLL